VVDFSNGELLELGEILHRNRHVKRSAIAPAERDRIDLLRNRLFAFLWKSAPYQTDDLKVASHAVPRAVDRFFNRLGWSWELKPAGAALRRLIWRRHTPRSWLLRNFSDVIQDLVAMRSLSVLPRAPEPPVKELVVEPALTRLVGRECAVACYLRPPELIRAVHCRWTCDPLGLKRLRLTLQEIGFFLFLPESTARARFTECRSRLTPEELKILKLDKKK